MLAYKRSETLRQRERVFRPSLMADHHEFFAAPADEGVVGSKGRPYRAAEFDEDAVARLMAEVVVHRLEMVDIEAQHGEARVAPPELR